jgi:hypothetical protein
VHDPGPVPIQVYPVSTAQLPSHPSPDITFPSSQVSAPTFWESPQTEDQEPAPVPEQEYPIST